MTIAVRTSSSAGADRGQHRRGRLRAQPFGVHGAQRDVVGIREIRPGRRRDGVPPAGELRQVAVPAVARRGEHEQDGQPRRHRGKRGAIAAREGPRREDRGVRFDDDRERQQQSGAGLAPAPHPDQRQRDERREQQVHLAEHELVRVELRHRQKREDDEQRRRPAQLRHRVEAEPEQRQHQECRHAEPRGLPRVFRDRRGRRGEHREDRQVLELIMAVVGAIERLGRQGARAGGPVDLEVGHLLRHARREERDQRDDRQHRQEYARTRAARAEPPHRGERVSRA